jgi:hypothetical protein
MAKAEELLGEVNCEDALTSFAFRFCWNRIRSSVLGKRVLLANGWMDGSSPAYSAFSIVPKLRNRVFRQGMYSFCVMAG